MTLLETAGLCALMFACFFILHRGTSFWKKSTCTVSYTMLVAVYVPWLVLLFPLLATGLDTGPGQVHVVSPVGGTQIRSRGRNNQNTKEGTNPVVLTNAEEIDTFEIDMALEQSRRKHARDPNPNLKNQHPSQALLSRSSSLRMIFTLNQHSCCQDCPS